MILRFWNFRHDVPMRLATREEIYKIDVRAAKDFNLTSALLVEKAGQALADEFERIFKSLNLNSRARIGIWCGPGKNGDDGRAMARVLKKKNFDVAVLEGTSWDPSIFDILIDGLFGVGLNRDIEGDLRRQIQKINAAKRLIFSLDIPSGLDANRGVVLGSAVRATWTLTIEPAKPGLFIQEGPTYAGRIRRVQIGFPEGLLKSEAQSTFLIGSASARQLLPRRKAMANKSDFGHLLVIAGSSGMEGAADLVSEAAMRMGCGYVTLCSLGSRVSARSRPDYLHLSLTKFYQSNLKKYSAVVVGPGLGLGEESKRIMDHLLRGHSKVLVDADALTILSSYPQPLKLPEGWILTPHAGELGRLLKRPSKELERDRLGATKQAVKDLNAHILFKGFRTVLGVDGKAYIIGSGNVALAKAGSGDVLSGFIGSLMAQGLPTVKAGVLGAYLHGRIADDWLRRGHSSRTIMASDLPELLDASLRSLKKGS